MRIKMNQELKKPDELINYFTDNGRLSNLKGHLTDVGIYVPEYQTILGKGYINSTTNGNKSVHITVCNSDPNMLEVFGKNGKDMDNQFKNIYDTCLDKLEDRFGKPNEYTSRLGLGVNDTLNYKLNADSLQISLALNMKLEVIPFSKRIKSILKS